MTSTRSAAATGLTVEPAHFLDPRTFPDRYGLTVIGDCMAPAYPDGCNVEMSKTLPYERGDVVAVWWRPELLAPGSVPCMIKRIVMMPPPWVTSFPFKEHPKSEVLALIMLGRDDMPDQALQVRCADILAIHKCVGVVPNERCFDARPSEMTPASRRRARQCRR